MEHNDLWKRRADYEDPVRFGVFYREVVQKNGRKDRYFLHATNMVRTYENLNPEFTPYSHTSPTDHDNGVSTHGYAGIALPLKIGGQVSIYFTDSPEFTTENEDYEEITMNIDKFISVAKLKDETQVLPSPAYNPEIPSHQTMLCFMESIWGEELLSYFREMNYKTFTVYYNPTFDEPMGLSIKSFLTQELDESFQNQFIKQLCRGLVQYMSSYEPGHLNDLPMVVFPTGEFAKEECLSIKGIRGQPEQAETVAFMRPLDRMANVLQFCYPAANVFGRVEFEPVGNRVKSYELSPAANPSFRAEFLVQTGVVSEAVQQYSALFKTDKKRHLTLAIDREGKFAEGVDVDIGDIPLTCKPIPHGLDDSSHLPGRSRQRTSLSIFPESFTDWKAEIYASEMKEDTHFRPGCMLVKAIDFVIKRYGDAQKKKISFAQALNGQKATQQAAATAAYNGNVFEKVEMTSVFSQIEGMKVIAGDANIKKMLKVEGQGVDHLLMPQSNPRVWIAVQDKLQQRVSKDKIESYLNTVAQIREKHPSQQVYALFINGIDTPHKTNFSLMDGLEFHTCLLRKPAESGEQFQARIQKTVQRIVAMFSKPV
jgi:hypothetical protein